MGDNALLSILCKRLALRANKTTRPRFTRDVLPDRNRSKTN